MSSRDVILARVRAALGNDQSDTRDAAPSATGPTAGGPAVTAPAAGAPAAGDPAAAAPVAAAPVAAAPAAGEPAAGDPVVRGYWSVHGERTPDERVDLLAEHLADYRAQVHRCTHAELAATIARLLAPSDPGGDPAGGARFVAPDGVPASWLEECSDSERVYESRTLSAQDLDTVDAVVTGCAIAIAETGTIVLDAGPDQGRRVLTLVPDHHVCVVRVPDQVVDSVPQALPRLDPTRPLTWISGPSATSDIELDRVEGVHGPRRLDVILVS